jgi:trk system potassium uptake protein TrkA
MGVIMKKTFGVIGIGAFGLALIEELSNLGIGVFAIDRDIERVRLVETISNQSAVCDSTSSNTLKDMGFHHLDHIIVSIGDIEASILTTMALVDLGCYDITVMTKNDYHEKVVKKLGATKTISPEKSTGIRIARQLMTNSVLDYFKVDEDFGVYEFLVRKDYVETSLISMDLRNKWDVSIVLIMRENETILPKGDSTILANDKVLVVGKHKKIIKFSEVIVEK